MQHSVENNDRDVCHCSVSSGPRVEHVARGHNAYRTGRAASVRRFFLPFLCVGFVARITSAQSAGVELRFDSLSLEVGESVNGQLVCTNTSAPTLPQFLASDGYDLKILTPSPATSQMTSIANGRTTQRVTHTYSLRLTALKEGTFTVGPAVVPAGGSTYQSSAVILTIRKGDVSPTNKGDRMLFVEVEVAPRSLYVTQEARATLVIGIRQVEIGGRTYDVDMIRQVLNLEGSELSMFSGGQASKGEMQFSDSQGARHTYIVYRVTKTVRAEEVGPLPIGPIFLRAEYPTAVRADIFGRLQVARSSKETARVEGIVIDVKGPPVEGRPGSFTGAIGQFKLHVTAKPDCVEQGEPLTLSVAMEGAPLAGVAGPDLSRIPELTARFDFSQDEPAGDIEGPRKVFRRAIFPKQFGDQTIPPVAWSYFDPSAERYVRLTSDAIPIAVAPRASTRAAISAWEEGNPSHPAAKLTVLAGGISPNFVDADAVLASETISLLSPLGWSSLLAPPVVYSLAALVTRHRRKLRADRGYARRRHALRHAKSAMAAAVEHTEPSTQRSAFADAFTFYLCERFDLSGGAMTPSEVRALLSARGFDPACTDEIVAFFEAADSIRYAPGAADATSVEDLRSAIGAWLDRLERHAP